MESSIKHSPAPLEIEFSKGQQAALIKLLGDEDPSVFRQIRDKIVASGPRSVEWLKPHLLSNDPLVRNRVRSVVQLFQRHEADNEFVMFCLNSGQDLDLERAVLLLSRTAYPEVNTEGYRALLDDFAARLRERLNHALTTGDILKIVRVFLFGELKFTGDKEDYYHPDNSYFTRVIDRRAGNPISLCTLYLLLSRRLQLPITGIGLPGHFLCRYQTSSQEVYIDAFNQGRLLSKADCVQYLARTSQGMSDDPLVPVSTRRMLLRICGNLHQIYAHAADTEEATRLRRYMVALSK